MKRKNLHPFEAIILAFPGLIEKTIPEMERVVYFTARNEILD